MTVRVCLALLLLVSGLRAADAPVFTRTIYLVRHAIYTPDATKLDGDLTPLGVAQARLVAVRLRGMPVAFTLLAASTFRRADQTARIIQQSLPQLAVQSSDLLRECTPRTWREDIMKGEKPEEVARAEEQLNKAFAAYFVPAKGADQHDILVCHGNVIRWFTMKALGVDTQAWLGLTVANCSLTIIQVTPQGAFKVIGVGDIGHIPLNLQTGLPGAPEQPLVLPAAK